MGTFPWRSARRNETKRVCVEISHLRLVVVAFLLLHATALALNKIRVRRELFAIIYSRRVWDTHSFAFGDARARIHSRSRETQFLRRESAERDLSFCLGPPGRNKYCDFALRIARKRRRNRWTMGRSGLMNRKQICAQDWKHWKQVLFRP